MTQAFVPNESRQPASRPEVAVQQGLRRKIPAGLPLVTDVQQTGHADSLALIEWPSCGQGFLPTPDLRITLFVADEGREAELTALTPRGEGWLATLAERRTSQA